MLERWIRPLRNRVLSMLARGVVRLVNDAARIQALQVEVNGTTLEGVEHFQSYGFTSSPHPGAEAVLAFVGGDRGHGIALAVDDRRYRLKPLPAGAVAIYTDEGDKVVLERGRVVRIVTQTLEVEAGGSTLTLGASGLQVATASGKLLELD